MQPSARVPLWFLFANWLLIVGAFAMGCWLSRRSDLPEPQFTALQVVLQEIERSHVEPQDPGKLLDVAIKAMASFDHYGQYVPAGEVDNYVESTTGNYEGIGIAPLFVDGRLYVKFPFADGPADAAGLRPGDEIVAIDGERVATLAATGNARITETKIRGVAGTSVQLQIARAGSELRTVAIERAAVHKPCVKWAHRLDPAAGLGYVLVTDFHPGADQELAAALATLGTEPGGLRGLILDLRFDAGGYLDACVAMANLFIARGTIVTVRKRGNVIEKQHEADPGRCRFPDLPLVVLVNRDSASASEVLTGALQDHGRATVVGELTYGKGMVNTVFTYKNLDFRLKVTTGRYFTPNGRNLEGQFARQRPDEHKGGIEPDRPVRLEERAELAVRTAMAEPEPPARYRDEVAALVQRHELRPPGIVPPADDAQLAAALAALRERVGADHGGK